MSGRQKTYKVELTETEQRQLQEVVSARKSSQSEAKRAKVVLTSAQHPDWTDAQVGQAVGCSSALVRKWRKRWYQTRSLKEAPRSGRPEARLGERAEPSTRILQRQRENSKHGSALSPIASCNPRTFLPTVRVAVTAIACSQPSSVGVPLARWSCGDIGAQLVTLGIVVSIATSTVWRWLKAERIKPWRFHAWMHPTDENFVAKATPVLRLYAQAAFLIKSGFWVVCVDEKTSIQARARAFIHVTQLHLDNPSMSPRSMELVEIGQPCIEFTSGCREILVDGCPISTKFFLPSLQAPRSVAPICWLECC